MRARPASLLALSLGLRLLAGPAAADESLELRYGDTTTPFPAAPGREYRLGGTLEPSF